MIATQELWTTLEPIAVKQSRARGEVLFRRGDRVTGIYLVVRGGVELNMAGVDSLFPRRIVGSGGVVGLPATMSGSPYSLTALVTEDAEVGFIPRKSLLAVLRKNPPLSFQVIQMLSDEIHGMRLLPGWPAATAAERRGTSLPEDKRVPATTH
jgi:CRP/FNR family transcriptional regulator